MKKVNNFKVGVIFSLLLFLSQSIFAQTFILNDDGLIDDRAKEKIEQIGSEVNSKLGINIYVYVKSTLGLNPDIKTKEKIYNVTTGTKVDLVTLSHYINNVSDFQSEITVLNEGLNNEYTSNNERLLKELGNFKFTSHQDAIVKMRCYFQDNLEQLDIQTIKEDPYIKKIDSIWKGK